MLQLERELVQARLKEAESQCALKEMQDKILDMEKVGDRDNATSSEEVMSLSCDTAVATGSMCFNLDLR